MANYVYLFHNGQRMPETEHLTRSVIGGDGDWGEGNTGGVFGVVSTGGREILMRAEQGDTLNLQIDQRCLGSGDCFDFDLIYNIFVCFEYNAM